MEPLNRRINFQEVLSECGYSGWYVVEATSLAAKLLFFNPDEKKMGEISVPDEWLDDPHRRKTIGESLTMSIQNCKFDISERP